MHATSRGVRQPAALQSSWWPSPEEYHLPIREVTLADMSLIDLHVLYCVVSGHQMADWSSGSR